MSKYLKNSNTKLNNKFYYDIKKDNNKIFENILDKNLSKYTISMVLQILIVVERELSQRELRRN